MKSRSLQSLFRVSHAISFASRMDICVSTLLSGNVSTNTLPEPGAISSVRSALLPDVMPSSMRTASNGIVPDPARTLGIRLARSIRDKTRSMRIFGAVKLRDKAGLALIPVGRRHPGSGTRTAEQSDSRQEGLL